MAPSKKKTGMEDEQLEIKLADGSAEKPKRTGGKAKKEAAPEPELTLEEAFVKLDEILEQLEQGEASLEDSFLLYQKGMQLLKQCNESIDRVEKKLIVLEEEGI